MGNLTITWHILREISMNPMNHLFARAFFSLTFLLAVALPAGVQAQAYPNKPIRIIIPYPPGALFDSIFRPLSLALGQVLGQPVVLEHRPGANAIIGMDLCAKAAPDGYTICATSSDSMSLNPYLYQKLPYDTDKDFAPVTNLLFTRQVIVANSNAPFNSFREMIEYAKSRPGALNFGSFGQGSSAHIVLSWINNRAGVNIAHVPYKGGGPVVAATVSGEVDMTYMGIGSLLPHIRGGRVKALAVAQSPRSALLPDVPTLAEQGMEFPLKPWIAVIAPAETPKPIVARLSAEISKIIHRPTFGDEYMRSQGLEPVGNSPEQFAEFLKEDRKIGAMLVKVSGIRLD